MKKILTGVFTVLMSISAAAQPFVFAMSDYENIYEYDIKDDVYRFDVGEFTEKTEDRVKDTDAVVKITNGIGLTEVEEEDDLITYDSYMSIIGKLSINKNYNNTGKVTMQTVLDDMINMLGLNKFYSGMSIEAIAAKEKLLNGIAYNPEAFITNKDVCGMLLNALNSRYVKSSVGATSTSVTMSEGSYMEEVLNIYKVSGLLDGVYKKSIFTKVTPREGTVTISRAVYLAGESNADEYFGKRVTAYVYYDSYDYIIKYISEEAGSKTVSFDLRDITDISGNKVYFENENGSEERIDISKIKYLNVNGDTKNVSEIEKYLGKAGNVMFSQSERNSGTDICRLEIFEHFVVNNADSNDNKIMLANSMSFKGENFIDTDKADFCEITKNQEIISVDEINYNDVITVYSNEDASYLKISVSDKKIVGTVESIKDNYIYIDNEKYMMAEEFTEKINTRDTGTFYISDDNYILNYKKGMQMRYGYMRRAYYDEDADLYITDIFGDDAKWQTYTLKDMVTIDADKMKASEAIEIMRNQKENIVRFKANGNNVISEIDTLLEGDNETDDKRLVQVYSGNVKQSWKGGIWFRSDMGYRFSDSAVLFEIPFHKENLDEYKVRSSGYLKNDEQGIDIVMYTASELGFCSAGIIESKVEKLSTDTKYWLFIERISEGINENDEPIKILKGTRLTATGTVNVEKDYEYKITDDVMQRLEEITPNAFQPGTLMYLSADSDEYIQNAQIEFTNAEPVIGYDTQGYVFQYFCGRVTIVDPSETNNGNAVGYFQVETGKSKYVQSAQNLILIDKKTMTAKKITCSEIRVGDVMYVARAFGEGRVCAVVR